MIQVVTEPGGSRYGVVWTADWISEGRIEVPPSMLDGEYADDDPRFQPGGTWENNPPKRAGG